MLLNGLRVLDLSTLLPGPMCSLFLADLGAEVIKVESPLGDPMRHFDLEYGLRKNKDDHNNKSSAYFFSLNRNKKSISLDLKTKEGKEIFMKLAKNSDVIIEGFRPGKVDELGVGYKDVNKINPGIVYCSITGYGQNGPYKNKAGHDLNYISLSGLIDALFTAKKDTKGFSKLISIAAVEKKFWEAFCKAIQRKDLVEKQFEVHPLILKEMKYIFKSRTMKEWVRLNKKYDFCCEPIKKIEDLIEEGNFKKINKARWFTPSYYANYLF